MQIRWQVISSIKSKQNIQIVYLFLWATMLIDIISIKYLQCMNAIACHLSSQEKAYKKDLLPEDMAGSQIDIMPTVIDLIAPEGFTYYSVGEIFE